MAVQTLSREKALALGLFIVGYDCDRLRAAAMNLPQPVKDTLNGPRSRTVDVYSLRRPSGEKVEILVGEFELGHGLWIRDPRSGYFQKF
jgi:hypothetical protein